jgi:hypothetical protein
MKKNTSIPVLREIHQLMSVTDTKTQRNYLYQCIPVNLRLLLDGFSEQKKYETQLIYIVLLIAKTKYIYNNAGQIAFLSTYRTSILQKWK